MTEAYTLKFVVVVCFSARECAQGLDGNLNFAYSDSSNYLSRDYVCATRLKNKNESKHKSECVYDSIKLKLESTKVVNTRLVCGVRVRGCCSAYM